jgi:hypothetical protein
LKRARVEGGYEGELRSLRGDRIPFLADVEMSSRRKADYDAIRITFRTQPSVSGPRAPLIVGEEIQQESRELTRTLTESGLDLITVPTGSRCRSPNGARARGALQPGG